ncbi:ATP-binding protein [Streptomyces sp. NBC_01276]|uniref:ATP-binding protein n=1 Tax=Streptomyces sp. NBC_01276 TaxID=2903808 RepID=UPI002F9108AA
MLYHAATSDTRTSPGAPRTGGTGLRIAVTDAVSTVPPSPPARPADAATGRGGYGWPLIHRLTRSTRITPAAHGGKRIEVVVPLEGAADSQGDPRPV